MPDFIRPLLTVLIVASAMFGVETGSRAPAVAMSGCDPAAVERTTTTDPAVVADTIVRCREADPVSAARRSHAWLDVRAAGVAAVPVVLTRDGSGGATGRDTATRGRSSSDWLWLLLPALLMLGPIVLVALARRKGGAAVVVVAYRR